MSAPSVFWQVGSMVRVSNVEHKTIYRPPDEPGFVCWPILWKESSGRIKCSFMEVRGNPALWPPTYNFRTSGIESCVKTIVSEDGGDTWVDTGWEEKPDPIWTLNSDHHCRKVLELRDGSLIRSMPVVDVSDDRTYPQVNWVYYPHTELLDPPLVMGPVAPYYIKAETCWKSGDGGRTWEAISRRTGTAGMWATSLLECRDGRLVAMGMTSKSATFGSVVDVAVSESLDEGVSWSAPCICVAVEAEGSVNPTNLCEENDVVELPDGRLLVVMRNLSPGYYLRTFLTRTAPGRYEATQPEPMAMVHSGFPFLLRSESGVIWCQGNTAHWASLDNGLTWARHFIAKAYYPQMVEVERGRILSVTPTDIGDTPFPYKYDTSIKQSRFSFEGETVIEQLDPSTALSLKVIDELPGNDELAGEYRDLHIYFQVRADGCGGIAFRVLNPRDAASYLFYAVSLPDNPLMNPALSEGSAVSAHHVIGRVRNGKCEVLCRREAGKIELGSWLELQVRAVGDLVQGALRVRANSPAYYIAALDPEPAAGRIGFMTDRSRGGFGRLKVFEEPRSIRDSWPGDLPSKENHP